MRFTTDRSSAPLVIASLIGAAGLVAIAGRVPISEGDDAFYASVARALPAHGSFDYLRFYGPVFFHAVALAFSWLGFSVFALRAVSLLGALWIVLAALALARTFGADAEQRTWICALLVFSPEVGWAATAGRMDSLAVGLELLGLAVVVRGITQSGREWSHGIGGGALLAGAALTTPRTFPFLASLALAALALTPFAKRPIRGQAAGTLAVAFLTMLAIVVSWIAFGAGGVGPWSRMMWAIATQQRDDVALLGGPYPLGFAWWRVVMPAVAVAGSVLVAPRRGESGHHAFAARFALATTGLTFVFCAALFTLPFFYATYWAVPLFVVVLALSPRLRLSSGAISLAALTLLAFFVAARVAKHVRSAVTWSARSDAPVERFIAAHVPPGSIVVGPHYLYVFPVERSASHYVTANALPWADWTRWISSEMLETPRSPLAPAFPASVRYLLWPVNEDLVYGSPPTGACAPGPAIATFEPPPDDLPRLSWLTTADDLRGYPRATLYRVRPDCRIWSLGH